MKTKKSLLLIFALALVAGACSTAATPCNEAEITTGENGLPDLGGCEFTFAVENAYLPYNYIDAEDGEAKGCAGGYMVEQKGAWLIDRVEGDWLNVVGLPLFAILNELRRLEWKK